MNQQYKQFQIRHWQPADRTDAAAVIESVLAEYDLGWDPVDADRDVLEVEKAYHHTGGEFWIIAHSDKIVGTAGYYPVPRGNNGVEIRKMYLLPEVRSQGLGTFILKQLEDAIAARHFSEIWIETASVLTEAVQLYERNGYHPATGVETARCDRIYVKRLQA